MIMARALVAPMIETTHIQRVQTYGNLTAVWRGKRIKLDQISNPVWPFFCLLHITAKKKFVHKELQVLLSELFRDTPNTLKATFFEGQQHPIPCILR